MWIDSELVLKYQLAFCKAHFHFPRLAYTIICGTIKLPIILIDCALHFIDLEEIKENQKPVYTHSLPLRFSLYVLIDFRSDYAHDLMIISRSPPVVANFVWLRPEILDMSYWLGWLFINLIDLYFVYVRKCIVYVALYTYLQYICTSRWVISIRIVIAIASPN